MDPDFGLQREVYTFPPEALGDALPEFAVLREIGKGSMGIVYEARRAADGVRVALKILPPSLTLNERTLARFLREGRLMARVEHPDIVRYLGQGSATAGGVRIHWFAMELVDGVSLQERLKVGPLPVRMACAIAARAGRALQFAHERGVVHRDVKPGNILLRNDQGQTDATGSPPIAVSDFGLARESGSGSMTESGALVGTPMFMAPELVMSGSAQAETRTDVYSLGATLYTLLAGRPPFDGPTAQSVLKAVLDHDPPRLGRLRADLPPDVEAIVQKAMSRRPERRYGSALEMSLDLERSLRGERTLARLPSAGRRALQAVQRRPTIAVAAAAALSLLVGAFWLQAERRASRIEQLLVEGDRWLAQAATARDESDRPRSDGQRRELLLAAISAAGDVLAIEDRADARVLRARAHQRLRQPTEALLDLDEAERLLGRPTPEILQFRVAALRLRNEPEDAARLQHDLTTLLAIDGGDRTRTMVAERLLEVGRRSQQQERAAALQAAQEVLAPVSPDNAQAAVLRARLLEAQGETEQALDAMRAARRRFQGDVYVHLQAAAMFDRLGLVAESQIEDEAARLLQPNRPAAAPPTVRMEGIGEFLGDVNRLLRSLDAPTEPGKDGG